MFEIEDTGPGMSPRSWRVRALRARQRRRARPRGRHGPGPDHRQDAHRADGRRDDGAQPPRPGHHASASPVPARAARRRAPAPRRHARSGYAGPRRRLLVVDNNEADRRLLVTCSQPLGFELRTPPSGEEALALLAPRAGPDTIFMDLAMPGIDGWETIRRIRLREPGRRRPRSSRPTPSTRGWTTTWASRPDFIVKPVRVAELLDWLGRAAGARMDHGDRAAARRPAGRRTAALPPRRACARCRSWWNMGYVRGIGASSTQIERRTRPSSNARRWRAVPASTP